MVFLHTRITVHVQETSRNDDELYGLYRRQGNVYVFKRAKSRMGAIFLSGGREHHSEYNFLD
jgi:hypothetical protein